MKQERINEPMPSGRDYSEIFCFDDNGNPVEKELVCRCTIRECMSNGAIINEIQGICN